MKQALLAVLLLLPIAANAQTAQPASPREQAMQNEMVMQLQAKLSLQATVIEMQAKIDELQKQIASPPVAKKD